jgi:hypothetical protein
MLATAYEPALPFLQPNLGRAHPRDAGGVFGFRVEEWLTRPWAKRASRLAARADRERAQAARGPTPRPLRAMSRAHIGRGRPSNTDSLRLLSRARKPHSSRGAAGRTAIWQRGLRRLHDVSRLHGRVAACAGERSGNGAGTGRLRALSRFPPGANACCPGPRLEPVHDLPPSPSGRFARTRALRGVSSRDHDHPRESRSSTYSSVHDLSSAPTRTGVGRPLNLPEVP